MRHILYRNVLWLCCLCVLFRSNAANAGDPEAHSAAMIQAANQVAEKEKFSRGVGAPTVNSIRQDGLFKIPTDGRDDCSYPPAPGQPFPEGCAYETDNGKSINEPDNWACIDPRQPDAINDANLQIAPAQSRIGTLLAAVVSEAAMVCNWNHFTSNPTIPRSGNSDARATFETVKDWANEIPDAIVEFGATSKAACDEATFKKFYYHTGNSLHYIQDSACEHHDVGNEVCYNTNPISYLSMNPIVDFNRSSQCIDWVSETIKDMVGVEPKYWCDEAVVEPGTRQEVFLNNNMIAVAGMCGIGLLFDLDGAVITSTTTTVPKMSLACMGLERTFRHHCLLDKQKSLTCQGPPGDHSNSTNEQQYCEGERISAFGGEDFMGKAVAASVPALEAAMNRWADVCKEPDDPCKAQQCDAWCKRTIGIESAGYCVNALPDAACQLHTCICDDADACGGTGQPCCTGRACRRSSDECGGQSGYCVEKDSEFCEDATGSCGLLAELCPNCDLAGNYDGCVAASSGSDEATCQAEYLIYLEACYPTSAYCEELRAICDTCTDENERINCIAASSSQYAYENPALCLEYDLSIRGGSCTVP